MRRRSLLNRSHVYWPDHTGRYPILYNCNHYVGCGHDCTYCYAKMGAKRNPSVLMPSSGRWRDAEPVENAVELLKENVKRKPGRVMFCSTCDPYQPLERELGLSRKLLQILLPSHHYVLITTKSDLVTKDYDLISRHRNVEIVFTITSLSDREARKWEPTAPLEFERIRALVRAKGLGIKTAVSIEPWIPGLTSPIQIIRYLGNWADRYIIGTWSHTDKVPPNYYHERLPDLVDFLEEGGYCYMLKPELEKIQNAF